MNVPLNEDYPMVTIQTRAGDLQVPYILAFRNQATQMQAIDLLKRD